jgi:hypothetical protein
MVERNIQLVFREDLDRAQRLRSKRVNAKLTALWAEFHHEARSARSLLSAGSRLICPRPSMDGAAPDNVHV